MSDRLTGITDSDCSGYRGAYVSIAAKGLKRVPKKSKIKLLLVAAQHSQKYRCVEVLGRQLITFIYCFHEIANSSPYSPAALLSRTPNHIHYLF